MTSKPCLCVELPIGEYAPILKLQHSLVRARKEGIIDTDVIILTEHYPVFTLGHRGGREHIIVSEEVLEKTGIPLVHVERGGNITFHGPGQLVVYPIIDLGSTRLSIPDYVTGLEEIMIGICREWGISAHRNPGKPGVWAEGCKLGSIGIAVRRGVSFHGLALNVNVSLDYFSWIHPCGMATVQATSLAKILGRNIPMKDIRETAFSHIQDVFKVQLEKTDPDRIMHLIYTMV